MLTLLGSTSATAQPVACPTAEGAPRRFAVIGPVPDDSARAGLLLGACWGESSLIRSSLSLNAHDVDDRRARSIQAIDATVRLTRNSKIPVSLNDGAMWAGRGWSHALSAGAMARWRNVRVVLAPQVVSSANDAFPILPSNSPVRSDYASPWHGGQVSADIPLRFGNRRYTRVDPGETSVEIATDRLAVGATSAAMWWGPGVRNALVMSNNAAGIPQVYARTARPLHTRAGIVEAHWLLGGLLESPFFDADLRNDLRSLSAVVVTLQLAADSTVTVGANRAVYAKVRRFGRIPGHWHDVFTNWRRSPAPGEVPATSEQVMSVFARWVIPTAGLEAHVDWARLRTPSSLRELLVEPQDGQGFTLGIGWARPLDERTTLKFEGEATMLEQTPPAPGAPVPEFYASYSVPQGYTQQGQVIGAAIGPGSSSQHLSVDILRGGLQVGGSIGRIRWEEGAYYRSPASFTKFGHDVSLYWGLNGRWDWSRIGIDAQLVRTRRLNYLFQTQNPFAWYNTGFDVVNTTITLGLAARP